MSISKFLGPIMDELAIERTEVLPGENFPTHFEAGMQEYLPLFFHFLTAQAIFLRFSDMQFNARLDAEVSSYFKGENVPPNLDASLNYGIAFSAFQTISVFYALTYVLIEGYKIKKFSDTEIDSLLENEACVEKLRRFRNSIFHYQEKTFAPKKTDYLDMDHDGSWIRQLWKAFDKFFEVHLRLDELRNGQWMEKLASQLRENEE